ncbi:conserved Plasmodium protein, unknown function [Plasmodium knowlesi strain H]|uniref:Uncharacterized protein n=3 Tax=Plasmodium knowlesi TaxID=5850 RepID=A0A5K1UVL6_PLAKH|nr:conserved Plasmodium protein, unknown function [Plasmodium knowlesi strain H]OTN68020.1 Uncharacterized protein PKNOH_S04351200 [Plasmodium knowlesi]CAA9990173.1 conserved Plasmodium protein, unknown function [Plasmodium knowlesi strain H]SBO27452.1 conserved Plasmodium protein, unknown function [Plasmodium knowlesi strain H]SBO28501.1 conserved Plasmodium protein, unknown function [Plasmodium knowlesi strain H]VVS79647.1 conserved Plasmodium protein, unknown function [Plasmodium knowlesi s|eukprot:XP_002258128.1 hypothetical protein, conserved in Plasmodium species [Plasmodium knowlesi strain H]
MIKNEHGKQNGKSAVGYLVLVLAYIFISALLSLYCMVRRAKGELQKCRPINWHLCRLKTFIKKTIKRILASSTWSDLKRHCADEEIFEKFFNIFKQRKWTPSDPKEGNMKTPKHIYIILKTKDVIILRGENKLSPYLVNIAVWVYEHKVAHMSIYVAECLLDSVFFDDLARGLQRRGFLMIPSAGGVADVGSVADDGDDMSKPRNATNLFIGHTHEFTVTKCSPPETSHTLHLKFVNKSNAHNRLIDIAEGSNITSQGEVVTDALRHPMCNKTVDGSIRKIIDFDKKMLFEEKRKTFQRVCYVLFFLFTEVKQISITQLKRLLPSMCKKVEWGVAHIIKRSTCFVTQLGVLYSPVDTSESNLWEKTQTQKTRTKISSVNCTMEEVEKRDDFPCKDKEPEGDTKTTLALMNEFLKNSIVKDEQSIDTIKQLIENNIPLYVQPICNDIFEASFNDTQVDVVLSLRIGLIDYLAYTLQRYQNGNSLHKENFFSFFKDYFSSFFFLYNVIHPFNKDGIQPWVLSNAEVYEFFDYSVASVRQALAYYGNSLQRHGC